MSKIAIFACSLVIIITNLICYPRWNKTGTGATISWDVSGYYMYLPAQFIYNDIKKCSFKDDIMKKYGPSPAWQQAFIHKESGNYVMKYSIGQAIMYSPFFAIGHTWASFDSSYPADGFSEPYQLMICLGMLLFSIIGLIFLSKILIQYFEEKIVALGILGLLLGTNYYNYSAVDGAMTHNTLFTIYCILIYFSIQFYKKPKLSTALWIGTSVGFASLIRPTEIISCLIPLLWGLNIFSKDEIFKRLNFYSEHRKFLISAVLLTIGIGFIQLAYWKYVSGDWLVYSYEDQGFSWLWPHLINGIFSYKSGWLMYSPFAVFMLFGFYNLFKNHEKIFTATFIFSMLFIYITFAWDIWWYGGSLGQRAMVQAYPILMFPLCAFIKSVLTNRNRLYKITFALFSAIFIYVNLWFTYQARTGGLLRVSQMTCAYYWKIILPQEENLEFEKLLDHDEIYIGGLNNEIIVYQDTTYNQVVNAESEITNSVSVSSDNFIHDHDWVRISVDVELINKEWNIWNMTHFIVKVVNDKDILDSNSIKIQRIMNAFEKKLIYIDMRKTKEKFTHLEILFWNTGSKDEMNIRNLKVTTFDE